MTDKNIETIKLASEKMIGGLIPFTDQLNKKEQVYAALMAAGYLIARYDINAESCSRELIVCAEAYRKLIK